MTFKKVIVIYIALILVQRISYSQNNQSEIVEIRKLHVMDSKFVKQRIGFGSDTVFTIKGVIDNRFNCLYTSDWTIYYDKIYKHPCFYISTNKNTNEIHKIYWFRNGNKKSESKSIGWKSVGEEKSWHENGELKSKRNYSNNPDTACWYFDNGSCHFKEIYFNEYVVKRKEYSERGSLREEEFYTITEEYGSKKSIPISGIRYKDDGSPLGFYAFERDTLIEKEFDEDLNTDIYLEKVIEGIRIDSIR